MPKIGELVDLVVFRFCLKVSPMLVKLSEKTDRTAWTDWRTEDNWGHSGKEGRSL